MIDRDDQTRLAVERGGDLIRQLNALTTGKLNDFLTMVYVAEALRVAVMHDTHGEIEAPGSRALAVELAAELTEKARALMVSVLVERGRLRSDAFGGAS